MGTSEQQARVHVPEKHDYGIPALLEWHYTQFCQAGILVSFGSLEWHRNRLVLDSREHSGLMRKCLLETSMILSTKNHRVRLLQVKT